MLLTPGNRLGPYEILSPLGAGGMGEVYRARDTRLGRDVAVKVLPTHLSEQPEIRARFEREAKTVSSLNHPNICTLFDVGKEGDVDYLVMELIEGDTLEARLLRGPLPSAEALRLGAQIADALDRAHRANVIHRDLKPGNVMLTRGGAKLMDFGLARATGLGGAAGGSSSATLAHSPTMGKALTAEGTILGTFQYMAPEQLEGKEADARSDIWALGCVLYEMFTGRRAFEGRSQASLIAAILEREPAPVGEAPSGSSAAAGTASRVQSAPPYGIDRLIRNCLAKDPEERIQTAHDVKLQLQGIAEGAGLSLGSVASASAVSVAPSRAVARGNARVAWVVAGVALLAAAGIFAWLYPRATVPPAEFRFRVGAIPGTTELTWPRISPDGRFLMVQGLDSLGVTRAYTRRLDEIDAHPVPGTEGLVRPYWSPDGKEIAYVANDRLMRVPIAGGSPTLVCAALGGADLSWGSKGMILVDRQLNDSLHVVPAGGGDFRPATRIDRAAGEIGSGWPCFLPDGEHFLFIGNLPGGLTGDIRLGKLGSLESKLLGKSDGRVEYAPGDWVLFLRGATLLAQKLDVSAGKLTGQPITIADNVRIGSSQGHFSVSRTGILTFALGDGGGNTTIQRADRTGALDGRVLVTGVLGGPALSPDGRRMLYTRSSSSASETGEIYVFDLDRSTDTRLTFSGGQAFTPHWSPDGRRFAFVTKGAAGNDRLRIGSSDGLGAQDSIAITSTSTKALWQWASAGSRLVYQADGNAYAVDAEGTNRVPQALVDSTFRLFHPDISPDGRWIAGTGGTAPGTQVFVQSLVGPPGRWQISTAPASRARWTKGGRELVFESRDNRMMAVDIETKDGFHAGTPHLLFPILLASPTRDVMAWTCDANGERFYLLVPSRAQGTGNIEVASGFHALVSRK